MRTVAFRRTRIIVSCVSVASLSGVVLQPRAAEAAPSAWTVTPSPNETSGSDFTAVSCSSADNCMAVGSGSNTSTDETLMELWDGTSWSITPSPSPGTFANYLYGVSCTSDTFCMAVGYYYSGQDQPVALAETWDGTSWSVTTVPNKGKSTDGNTLQAVSRTNADFCVAVGGYSGPSDVGGTLVDTWNGTSWSITPSPANRYFQGVSCTSPTFYVAVGSLYSASHVEQTFVGTWNGTTWSSTPSPNEGGGTNYLAGVSCTSSTSCMAVGIDRTGSQHIYQTLAESWNGTTWSISASPDASSGSQYRNDNYLEAVSCTDSTDCVAVGYYGPFMLTLVEIWTGTSWSIIQSPSPGDEVNHLFGVSCTSVTTCVTAGEYYNQSPDTVSTLVETGSFPPPTITSFSPTSGPAGTVVTIHGTNLQDATQVTFDGVPATIKKDSATKIKVTVPADAGSGDIEITDPGGMVTSTVSFTVT